MCLKRVGHPHLQLIRLYTHCPPHRCIATSVRLHQHRPKEPERASARGLPSSSSSDSAWQNRRTSIKIPQDNLFVDHELKKVHDKVNSILESTAVPSEATVQEAVETCEVFSEALAKRSDSVGASNSPTAGLLDLEEGKKRRHGALALATAVRKRAVENLSKLTYTIVTAPQVFITPQMLSSYVNTQSLLGRPETIPPIFLLYASKLVPQPNTSPIRYKSPNPSKASSAVPLSVANAALTSAINQRNLPVCLDIINTSVCANAFRRAKLLKRALLPCSTLALVPIATWVGASRWAEWQDTLDFELARNIMFGGLLAYVSFTATLGMVAITTANDHMDRVTWVIGTPLRERWLREEERAMVDRVAGAWGFEEPWRRGEEDGPDWERLREWIGLRGMVLDKVELMEGME